jgi:hypothetical protein
MACSALNPLASFIAYNGYLQTMLKMIVSRQGETQDASISYSYTNRRGYVTVHSLERISIPLPMLHF